MRAFITCKMSKIPGFDQHFPAKCSVFHFLFGTEHYESLEIALTNVGLHYLKTDLFHIDFCNDVAHCFLLDSRHFEL
jgi:hypothetical protein